MTPDAIYYFNRIPKSQTHYKQVSHKGKEISEFPSVYKNGRYMGEKYIIFQKTPDYYNHENLRFSHALELEKSQIITRFIFMPEYPQQSHGAYKEYGVLIGFSEDFEQLAIWFFEGLQAATPILFQRWQAGGIPEIAESEKMELKDETTLSCNKLLYLPNSGGILQGEKQNV